MADTEAIKAGKSGSNNPGEGWREGLRRLMTAELVEGAYLELAKEITVPSRGNAWK